MAPQRHAIVATVLLLLGILGLGLVPGASAQSNPASWSTPVGISTDGNVASLPTLINAGDTEKLGLLLLAGTPRFYTKADTTGPWTQRNADVDGAFSGSTLLGLQLAWVGDDDWVATIQYTTLDEIHVWLSTDDGVTWTDVHTFTGVGDSPRHRTAYQPYDGRLGLVHAATSGGSIMFYWSNTDGDTWGGGYNLRDNQGAPTGTCGSPASTADAQSMTIFPFADSTTPGFEVWWHETTSNPNRVYSVGTTDYQFWSVPFTTNCSTSLSQVNFWDTCGNSNANGATGVGARRDSGNDNTIISIGTADTVGADTVYCFLRGGAVASADYDQFLADGVGGGPALSINGDGQVLVAVDSGSDLEIYYNSAQNAPYELVHTVAGANPDGALTIVQTPTRAYVLYVANDAGGPLREIHATVFGAGASGGIGPRFCAEPTIEDFGYTYVEQVAFDTDLDTIDGDSSIGMFDLEDGFLFEGDSDNSNYLGKGFTTGSKSFAVKARIEAGTDGRSTLFRIAFTTGAAGLPSATTKGDGTDGGNFDDHVQARFLEDGGDWVIGIYENVGGEGMEAIGQSVRHGDPNNPTTYNFTVDSRSPTPFARVTTGDGTLLINRTLNPSLTDVEWKDQWFIGKGATGALNAFSALDDNTDQNQNSDSTCIFDLVGTSAVEGSPGSAPGSGIPDDGSTDPDPQTAEEAGVVSFYQTGVDAVATATGLPVTFAAMLFGLFGMVFTVTFFAVPTFLATSKAAPRHAGMLTVVVGVVAGSLGMVMFYAFGLIPGWIVTFYVILLVVLGLVGGAMLVRR